MLGFSADRTLEWFLVERYLLFTTDRKGRIRCGRVHHKPYRIERAECSEWTAEPIRENGFAKMDSRDRADLPFRCSLLNRWM